VCIRRNEMPATGTRQGPYTRRVSLTFAVTGCMSHARATPSVGRFISSAHHHRLNHVTASASIRRYRLPVNFNILYTLYIGNRNCKN